MPTYQYRCTECGHDLEAVQKFTDAALTECPSCGGTLRKIYNAVGVVFKGSGFYRTDSRKADGSADGNGNGNGKVETKGDSTGATTNGSGSGAADKPGKSDSSPSTPAPAAASTSSSSTGAAGATKAS